MRLQIISNLFGLHQFVSEFSPEETFNEYRNILSTLTEAFRKRLHLFGRLSDTIVGFSYCHLEILNECVDW